ncbi:epidermal growth factor receptor kinase substrate 8-like [Diadema setosum]|uniref:epidermal growth factor receptor kinase substrate 8-like n=1 Tax=Diadema setosum TaxID=31175 RepID=UPI003B3BDA5C
MPIPTSKRSQYQHESAYGPGPQSHQAMNGHLDRGQIPNGYPSNTGRQNGQTYGVPNGHAYGPNTNVSHPHNGPSRGANNNNHKSLYGGYNDPRQSSEALGRDGSRRPVSYAGPQHTEPQPQQQPQSLQRQNRFPVEHLYTFPMDKKEGVLSVEDGIRKLRLLDAKGKIWSQDVRLTMTEKDVILLDEYTQETLEVFPLQDIGAISAEIKQCNYDSLLVIIVRYGNKRVPEMMMFQCEQVPAPEIARSLQRAVDYYTTGKKKKSQRPESYAAPPLSHPHGIQSQAQVHADGGRGVYDTGADMFIPPPPDEPAPPPPIEGNVKNKVAAFAAAAAAAQANGNSISPRGFQSPKSAPVRSSESEEPLELLALRTERDVEILNHCFDDIEAFIGRLQKAAEAYTELTRRRQTRKGRRREHGDGLLLARSRPPTDGEYIECFQKFKYCFNLLAKLKAHIHDPNAPELVHFLFVPLKLIIQSCQGPELAASVVSPLLTPQAVDLLQNCLTSREHEVWMSLGRAWTLPGTEWPKDRPVSRYVPRFRDGWTPRPIPESQGNSELQASILINNASMAASAAAVARESPRRMSDRSLEQTDGPGPSSSHQRQLSNSSEPIGHSTGPAFHTNGPTSHANGNSYHQRQASDPVTHSPRPSSLPSPTPPQPLPKPAVSAVAAKPGRRMAIAIFDFVARNSKELTIMADEQLEILNDQRKWWEVRNTSGQSGYVPSTLLKVMTPSPNTNTNSNHVPEPPSNPPPPAPPMAPFNAAPPPPPPPPPADNFRRPNSTHGQNGMDFAAQLQHTLKNKQLKTPVFDKGPSTNKHDDLHEELMRRVSTGVPKRNYRVPRRSISDVNLTYDSGREDVMKWLESKGFSPLTIHSLGILNGAQLFSLTKEEIQQVCHDDGSRVYSQLMIQKAALQESQNGPTELQAIMQQRKERSGADTNSNLPPPEFDPLSPPVFDSPTEMAPYHVW